MRLRREVRRAFLALAISLLGALFTAGVADAATIVVANTGDAANGSFDDLGCTLRDAVQAANTNASDPNGCNGDNAGADTILLQGGQTYVLTQHAVDDTNEKGDLDITGPVTIRSTGPGLATIDARSNLGPSPPTGADRAIDVLPSAGAVTLEGLRIEDGLAEVGNGATGGGGGVLNEAQLTVRNSEVRLNQVKGEQQSLGGGIYSRGALGRLTVIGSTVAENKGTAVGGNAETIGGGIAAYKSSPALTITNSTVSGNSLSGNNFASRGVAAGVFAGDYLDYSLATLTHVTIADNHTFDSVGGLEVQQGTLTGNLIAGNVEETRSKFDPDCYGGGTSGGGNLLGNPGENENSNCGFTAAGDLVGTFAAPINANLGTLVDNGGPTKTRTLNPGSLAIDRGGPCPETDQRGLFRAAVAPCDAGAVEVGATVSPPVAPAPAPAPVLIPTPTALAPTPLPPAPAPAAMTGKRARALAKCKTKTTAKARRICRRKAHKLPV